MSLLNSLVPESLKEKIKKLIFGSAQFGIHYSQSGEDLNLLAVLNSIVKVDKGFYIDVGSFHPTIGSNTCLLYRRGWNGINIDPRPGSKLLFDKERTRDINLEVGIGSEKGTLQYYFISDTSAMNSFSKKTLEENGVLDQVKKIIDCKVITMADVIREHLPHGKEIDFLNIDAEGFELEVLSTINWTLNRPKIIAIEQNRITSLKDVLGSETNELLNSVNYTAIAKNVITKTVATVLYADNRYL